MAIHLALTPGILNLRDPSHTLLVCLSGAPMSGKGELVFFEVDAKVSNETTQDDTIATVRGTFRNRVFAPDPGQIQPAAKPGQPRLSVVLACLPGPAGQPIVPPIRLPDFHIPAEPGETEHGVLEIGARMLVNGSPEFTTHANVFARDIDPSGRPTARPVITFITGDDDLSSHYGPFFRSAERFWNDHADGVFRVQSLEAILDFLDVQNPLVFGGTRRPKRERGPWGQINIVTHGTSRSVDMRLRKLDSFSEQLTAIRIRERSAADLTAIPARPALRRPGEDELDAQSVVVIRGCELGNDQGILNEMKALFGGRAAVYGCKFLTWYGPVKEDRGTREYLREWFNFASKEGVAWNGAAWTGALTNDRLAAGLATACAANPSVGPWYGHISKATFDTVVRDQRTLKPHEVQSGTWTIDYTQTDYEAMLSSAKNRGVSAETALIDDAGPRFDADPRVGAMKHTDFVWRVKERPTTPGNDNRVVFEFAWFIYRAWPPVGVPRFTENVLLEPPFTNPTYYGRST